MRATYACRRLHVATYDVTLMCRVLRVSASGYYAARHRPPSARTLQDEPLRLAIRVVHRQSRRRYGAPQLHASQIAPDLVTKVIASAIAAGWDPLSRGKTVTIVFNASGG